MQVLQQRIGDERAWTPAVIGQDKPWCVNLDQRCWDLIDPIVQEWNHNPQPATQIRLNETQCQSGKEVLAEVLRILDAGYGFVLLDGIPLDRYSRQEASLIYWLIGQMIGQPFPQNVKGTLLYDVRDVGADYTKGARFSVTNAGTPFHTDGAFNQEPADYVGLLCLRPAKSGGKSQMLSAYSLHNRLIDRSPELLETLYQEFHFDRRGEFEEGESPTSEHPVFDWDGAELTMRYLSYYIHEGHRERGLPLSAAQQEALQKVEKILEQDNLFVEFTVRPGQMLFCNNHWILHSRSGYKDHGDLDLRRHYLRLWLWRHDPSPFH